MAAKRGNAVYNWKVKKRFEPYEEYPDVEFFNPKDRSKRQETKVIFITLTYDRNIRLDEAWEQIGADWNRYITGLREKYGKIETIRTWEAQQDGYPHIHALLFFHEHYFDAFHYNGKWRVQARDDIISAWVFGFTDVQAMSGYHGGLDYILKYIKKIHGGCGNGKEGKKVVLTLALMWIFRKRAFSVSGGILDLIRQMRNSKPPPPGYMVLDGFEVHNLYTWTLRGFWGGKVDGGVWSRYITRREFSVIRFSRSWSSNQHLKEVR